MIRNRPKLNGVLTGLAVTVVCATAFFIFDAGRQIELSLFDQRVRLCNNLKPDAPIVHVDIDDGALDEVGRWPWRRSQLAEIIRTLDEFGAKSIVVDLLLSEYEEPFIDHPRYGPFSDVEPDVQIVGELSEENDVFGDLELAAAIRSAGNVYLASQFNILPPGVPDPFERRLRAWWKPDQNNTPNDVIDAFELRDTREDRAQIRRELLLLRLRHSLLDDFTLSDTELAARLNCGLTEVSAVLAGVKADVARELVAACFHVGDATPERDAVLAAVLHDAKDKYNADRADVLSAYRHNLGLAALRHSTYSVGADALARFHRAIGAVPPHFFLANSAHRIAVVNFSPDIDGAVRRVPIVVNYEGRAVLHLGLAVACDMLGLDPQGITVSDDNTLAIPAAGGGEPCRVPLDSEGKLIIPWTNTAKHWRAGQDFHHVSAAKVWSIVDRRREIETNETAINYMLADVVALTKGEITLAGSEEDAAAHAVVQADNQYRTKVNRQLELQRLAHLARLQQVSGGEAKARRLEQEAAVLLEEIQRDQQLAISAVELACKELGEISPEEFATDAALREEAKRYRWAKEVIDTDIARHAAANAFLRHAIKTLEAEVADELEGKHVFLGFAATAAGDIVVSPIDPRTPGVMCHAQVLNAFLQGRFISPRNRWVDLLLCIALGTLVSFVTAVRGPKFALLTALIVILTYTLLNAYVFFLNFDRWIALAGTLVTMAIVWAVVTLFRQLTAERERRFFAKQLGQYTSPAIAAKIAESPEAAQAFKSVQTRDVTCFFSDLKGFTTITEQVDAEVVQYVLNTYLEAMSRAIWSTRGLINKFMGDGIMAFFNASVDPVTDHPHVACEAALIAFDELEKLKRAQASHPAGGIFERLEMRVGLASGTCKNGDLGSELKADYTVIGDVVNLAARLEPANKVFGTRIMISGSTHDAVADHYEFRYLAELQVKGKAKTVPAYEVVCRKGELNDEQRAYIERFEAGVELYKRRQWDDCIVHFTRMLARRVDDPGASRYIDACQEFKTFPPPDDWAGALELKEK
ncbi:MAG: CHASE2 domain-containing protein [Planctomycetota bacterium]